MRNSLYTLLLFVVFMYSCDNNTGNEKTNVDTTEHIKADTIASPIKNTPAKGTQVNLLTYTEDDANRLLYFEKFSLGITSAELFKKIPDLKSLHAEDNNQELKAKGLEESIQEISFLNRKGKLEFNFRNDTLYRYSIVINESNETKASELYEQILQYYSKRLGDFQPVNIEEDNHYAQLNTWYLNPDYLIAAHNLNTGNITIAAQSNKPGTAPITMKKYKCDTSVDQMNLEQILSEIAEEILPYKLTGEVASYIPELRKVDPSKFGMSIQTMNGMCYSIGNSEEKFSIQSISKVFSVSLAYSMIGESIWKRVGVEPSGTRFNSLIQLELEQGIPRNPFINAGAIVISDILLSLLKNPKEDYLAYVHKVSGINTIQYNPIVVESEKGFGFRNAALVNFMKSFENIQNEVEEVLDFYYHACSIEMTCTELSKAFIPFANHGCFYNSDESILNRKQTKRMNALMQTCGFYDEAGEFSFRIGLPGKSGVGGGIVAVCPKEFTVAVWGPGLNKKGNSVVGMKALELLTDKTGLSVF